ncbi:MAG: GNAT family N-acetyltransferase [Rhizobiales bacterium 65-9]|nr:GNAT family N-acetyltransferase [Hyphomicrobiales bacterium]OJY34694.1 MAG: GNAT family N-acetyltransferase [Rhizobiales bacterium 65-9]
MPILQPGYSDVPPGHLAAVATTLEMRAPPAMPPAAQDERWRLRAVVSPDIAWYRALYRAIGEEWLWTSRLRKSDAELAALLNAEGVEVYALTSEEQDCGLLELDFRVAGACEIVYFGVTPAMVGVGAAHWLMRTCQSIAWARDISRLWLHTCTLDHPRALGFYMRAGFTPIKREVEVFPDPRLDGALARDAAPHVPIL